jgi:ankyrin repeat protein
LATSRDRTDVINLFLDNASNASDKKRIGQLALSEALKSGQANVAKLLLDNVIDVNAKDEKGETALLRGAIVNDINVRA